jgi:nucleoside 2-deoxyribosyltransferase
MVGSRMDPTASRLRLDEPEAPVRKPPEPVPHGQRARRQIDARRPPGGDTWAMRIYFAGPLFNAAERDWNAALAAALRGAGHEVFLPQEQEPAKDAAGIFATDVGGIDWADSIIAIMDGPDPDSGTCWEVGYAYQKKPIVLVRTDMRRDRGSGGSGYNAMLTESATIRVDAVAASIDRVASELLDALARLEAAS